MQILCWCTAIFFLEPSPGGVLWKILSGVSRAENYTLSLCECKKGWISHPMRVRNSRKICNQEYVICPKKRIFVENNKYWAKPNNFITDFGSKTKSFWKYCTRLLGKNLKVKLCRSSHSCKKSPCYVAHPSKTIDGSTPPPSQVHIYWKLRRSSDHITDMQACN